MMSHVDLQQEGVKDSSRLTGNITVLYTGNIASDSSTITRGYVTVHDTY